MTTPLGQILIKLVSNYSYHVLHTPNIQHVFSNPLTTSNETVIEKQFYLPQ